MQFIMMIALDEYMHCKNLNLVYICHRFSFTYSFTNLRQDQFLSVVWEV